MSKLIGRKPIEIKLSDIQNGYVPVFDSSSRSWATLNKNDLTSGSATISGSNTFSGNQTISGSLTVTQGITGSLYGTASSLPYEVWKYGGNDFGIVGGPNRIIGTLSDHDLVIYTSGSQRATFTKGGNFVLGNGLPDIVAAEKILIDAGETTSYNLIKGRGSADSYLQFNIQNQSTGAVASTDIAATADNGTESTIYVDMGINGSGFVHNPDYSVGYANDTYLLSVANDHWIGSPTSGKITLFTGDNFDGESHAKLILRATNNHEISGSLNISGSLIAQSFTGSLLGTASYATQALSASYWSGSITNVATASFASQALSSSYAATSSYADNFTITGTLTAQTIVAQTITSSIEFITGSTRNGSLLSNTHQFTGSVGITGSLSVNNSSVIASNQTSSMSVATASYAQNAVSASYWSGSILNATSASYATQALSASYWSGSIINAQSASYAQNAQSASYVFGLSNGTSSYALNADLLDGKDSTIFATTGSNTFIGSQNVSGGLSIIGNNVLNSGNSNYIHGIGIENNGDEVNKYITLLYTNAATSLTSSVEISGNGTQLYARSGSDVNQLWVYPTEVIIDKKVSAPSFTGSLQGTASSAVTASYALTASYVQNAQTASYWSGSIINAETASYVQNAQSASYVLGISNGTASYAANADLLDGKDSSIFATTGSNTFKSSQTIQGNLFMSGSFPLVYNNDSTNNMLFGMFDGSAIYGPYYQLFGNQYSNISQRGGAEFVYDVRNNADANFHISSYNGSTWTQKLLVNDNGVQVTGSLNVSNGITGSLQGTASYAANADLLDGYNSSVFATTGSNTFDGTQTIQSGNALKTNAINNVNSGQRLTIDPDNTNYVYIKLDGFDDGGERISISNTFTNSAGIYLYTEGGNTFRFYQNQLMFPDNTWQSTAFTGTATTSSYAATASSADDFTVRGTLTAQTIVAQIITSSVEYITGSTQFGSLLSNTHQFTGSILVTGSLNVNGSNVVLTNQTSSMSVLNAQTASYVLNAISSSYASNADLLDGKDSTIFATTGSNVFKANQTVSGSINIESGNYITSYSPGAGGSMNVIGFDGSQVVLGGVNVDAIIASNRIKGANGTANAPSFTFDDSNTGLYRIGEDNLGITAGGITQVSINTSRSLFSSPISASSGITGSLFGTASYAAQSLTSSYANVSEWNGLNNKPISSSLGSALVTSTTVVASVATASYSAAFFDYAVVSGSNLRAGTVMTIWNGSSVEYTETSTKDIGNTSQVTMSADLSSGNIQLKATTTDAWTVKSLIRLI